MFCSSCGVQNEDGSIFCSNCGSKQDNLQQQSVPYSTETNQNNQYQGDLYQNKKPQYITQQSHPQQPSNYGRSQFGQPYGQYPIKEKIHPIYFILSFFIFPAGLILYFSNKRQRPRSAKNLLLTTIVGFFIFWIV